MIDFLQAVLALSLTACLMWVMVKGASVSHEDEQPLVWLFNGLKWHIQLLIRMVGNRTSRCLIEHKIVASELAFYGHVKSVDELRHVHGCNRHQNIVKKSDLPRVIAPKRPLPMPPKGAGAAYNKPKDTRLMSGQTTVQQRAILNDMLDIIERQNNKLENLELQIEKMVKLRDLDEGNRRNQQRLRDECTHTSHTVQWQLDGIGYATCNNCYLTKRVDRGHSVPNPGGPKGYVSPWWLGAP